MTSAALTRPYIHRLFAFSLLFGAVAEAKLKLTKPSSARIVPFRSVEYCYFTPKLPVSRPRTSGILSRSYIFFFRAASFFTDQTFVSRSLMMYRGWANVLLPLKLVFKSQNVVPHYGRFRGLMDAPAQPAGPAIEGRAEIAEHDFFESPMCDIPAGSGGLSATSVNATAVSPICAGIVVCLRARGKPTIARAARANEKFRLFAVCSRLKSRGCGVTLPYRVEGQGSRFLLPESLFVGMHVFNACAKIT